MKQSKQLEEKYSISKNYEKYSCISDIINTCQLLQRRIRKVFKRDFVKTDKLIIIVAKEITYMKSTVKILTKEELRETLKVQYGKISDVMLTREYQSYIDRLNKNFGLDLKA